MKIFLRLLSQWFLTSSLQAGICEKGRLLRLFQIVKNPVKNFTGTVKEYQILVHCVTGLNEQVRK